MKKRLSLGLVLSLLLAVLSTSAGAVSKTTTRIVAEPYLPDIQIEVVVPASGNVYINPKQLPVKIGATIQDNQIVSDAFVMENLSEVPLSVSVDVTGKVKTGSKMTLSSASTADSTSTLKRAFLFFEIHAASDPDSVAWSDSYDEDQHIVIRTIKRTVKNIVTLGSADQAKRYGAFRLAGDCTQEPKEAWTSKDGVTVDVIFTFSPLPVGTEIP